VLTLAREDIGYGTSDVTGWSSHEYFHDNSFQVGCTALSVCAPREPRRTVWAPAMPAGHAPTNGPRTALPKRLRRRGRRPARLEYGDVAIRLRDKACVSPQLVEGVVNLRELFEALAIFD
jgi:hypothetical protein